ncbi:MAG: TMEM165/GDT1 family protein [Cyanobium sp. PLM2.Bin73]|nr:MAG: TMEM165/GDT1 family protein [Cyanobium sp. PLM2.Bin73]
MNSDESRELPTEGGLQAAAPAAPATGAFLGALLTTFTTVFLAELGDKTQLAALLLSAQSGQPLVVFIGASLALISSSLVGVLLGRWLARLLPAHELERLAGLLMVGLSLWLGRQAVVQLNSPPPGLPLG